ncbi:MAG: hypothetical protein MSJ26_06415 [Oscillospiraceae bacterium]|nr:hypothetical protein [Oscillospiraceae bacterium]
MDMNRLRFLGAVCAAAAFFSITAGCSRVEESPVSEGDPSIPGSSLSANEDVSFDNSRYIYSLLSPKEQEYYDIIRDAAMDFQDTAVFPEAVDPDTLRKVYISVYYQEEDIFWLSSMFYRPAAASQSLMLTYRFSKEECEPLRSAVAAKTEEILSSIDQNASDYEKLKAFHDHLVLNCSFSMDTKYANTIYGSLCDGFAQCEGYAFAFDYLCSKTGIDCFTVSGTNPDGEAHAWNMVRLEDMWYNVDCTWDDPILSPPDRDFIRYYYFLTADSDIIGVTHFPDSYNYFSYPLCISSENYYKREGYFADSAEEGVKLLEIAAADALRSGRKDAAVRFSNERAYLSAINRLWDGKEIKKVLQNVNNSSDVKVNGDKHIRYLNDDELIIHISMILQ